MYELLVIIVKCNCCESWSLFLLWVLRDLRLFVAQLSTTNDPFVFFSFFSYVVAGTFTDDEGGCVKPLSSKTRKSSQSDLYMRLGLLLGSGNLRGNHGVDTVDFPGGTSRPGQSSGLCPRPQVRLNDARGHDTSFSSLTSFETQTLASTNTSPVSTLTGTSSEAEVAAALRSPIKPKGKSKGKGKVRDCDSAGSLASISTSVSASTSMSMSMSVSVSGLSNGSSSPLTPRRHSATNQPGHFDEREHLKNRRCCVRRSARGGNVKGPIESKCKDPMVSYCFSSSQSFVMENKRTIEMKINMDKK